MIWLMFATIAGLMGHPFIAGAFLLLWVFSED